MCFMDYKSTKDYYEIIKKEFRDDNEIFNKFYAYFEVIWLSEYGDETVKYNFDL